MPNDWTSSIICKAFARAIQITEASSGPIITKEEHHFAEMIEEVCLLLAFPTAKYKDTQQDFEEER